MTHLVEVLIFAVYAWLVATDEDQQTQFAVSTPLGVVRLVMGGVLILFSAYFLRLEWQQRTTASDKASDGTVLTSSAAPPRRQSLVSKAIEAHSSSLKQRSMVDQLRTLLISDLWDPCGLLSQLLVVANVVAHFAGMSQRPLVSLMALTSTPLLMKTLGCVSVRFITASP